VCGVVDEAVWLKKAWWVLVYSTSPLITLRLEPRRTDETIDRLHALVSASKANKLCLVYTWTNELARCESAGVPGRTLRIVACDQVWLWIVKGRPKRELAIKKKPRARASRVHLKRMQSAYN
jgi:hypothetical protein